MHISKQILEAIGNTEASYHSLGEAGRTIIVDSGLRYVSTDVFRT